MMNIWQAIALGAIQGFTEFLPVSSSGHLALAQSWFNLKEPLLSFDIFLHGASLIAIIIFFLEEIKKIRFKQLIILGIGTIPAVLVGIFLKDYLEILLKLPLIVGAALVVTGINNLIINKLLKNNNKKTEITHKKALIIGVFQSLALVPGISRSGTTLLGSLGQNLEKKQAFSFTFLLAIPAVLGALLLQTMELVGDGASLPNSSLLIAGGVTTLITSLLSLNIIKKLIKNSKFSVLGVYAIALGLLTIIASLA